LTKIKVLIADDSAFMRKLLTDIINSDEDMEVVAQARNGEDALAKISLYKPDVVTLDVEMPVMDGLTALERIMQISPLPIVMLSAHTNNGTISTLKALEIGAVDFVTKPGGTISPGIVGMNEEIIRKIKTAAKVSIENIGRTFLGNKVVNSDVEIKQKMPIALDKPSCLIVIGTSTGGPKALNEVMSRFTRHHNAAVLIVQHMPPGFTKSLAQRLDGSSVYMVKEAENKDEVKAGMAYVAPGNYHMEIKGSMNNLTIHLNQSPQVNGHRPSVDVLMQSVARIQIPKVGVIMTGMGSDGAIGKKSLKETGSINIGESDQTCVVYSMPRSAKNMGAIDHEVPLYQIAELIEKTLTKR
jgi:two-component system chemotaxis response regulator CheB